MLDEIGKEHNRIYVDDSFELMDKSKIMEMNLKQDQRDTEMEKVHSDIARVIQHLISGDARADKKVNSAVTITGYMINNMIRIDIKGLIHPGKVKKN